MGYVESSSSLESRIFWRRIFIGANRMRTTFCRMLGLLLVVQAIGCDVVVRNEPDVNVQRLSQNWPPYQAPVVSTLQPEESEPQPDAQQPVEEPRRLVPIRRAEEWDLPETAMDSLGRIGAPAVPALIEALDHSDAIRRAQAAKVLARIGPEARSSVPALVRALEDNNETVRKAAARALGQIGPEAEDAVLPLLEIIEQAPTHSGSNVMPTSANEPIFGP